MAINENVGEQIPYKLKEIKVSSGENDLEMGHLNPIG